ncbi:MAG: tRNA (adenosine(37)-N6)-threonylcarbamoyltransferase complex dimerization subunit type 1 TsaB [Clostridia bacterium]|nr:tRNA (adenosine(37)-N6)-threonylcarbamoyltransferase complex dimerization subunit type 1 TsaB [Clostridia bacterium]
MNILAIDTSGNHLSIVLFYNDKVYSSHDKNINLKHSVTLLPALEDMLENNGVSLSEIDVFCSVVGPGSFTGIRIGVSTVKALAYAFDKKVLQVTSFDVLAYNKPSAKVLTLIDAKHGHYYACGYDNLQVVLPPCYIDETKVAELSKEYFLLSGGDGDILGGLISAVKAKLSLATSDRESLIPLYVKKSQAEEERK